MPAGRNPYLCKIDASFLSFIDIYIGYNDLNRLIGWIYLDRAVLYSPSLSLMLNQIPFSHSCVLPLNYYYFSYNVAEISVHTANPL